MGSRNGWRKQWLGVLAVVLAASPALAGGKAGPAALVGVTLTRGTPSTGGRDANGIGLAVEYQWKPWEYLGVAATAEASLENAMAGGTQAVENGLGVEARLYHLEGNYLGAGVAWQSFIAYQPTTGCSTFTGTCPDIRFYETSGMGYTLVVGREVDDGLVQLRFHKMIQPYVEYDPTGAVLAREKAAFSRVELWIGRRF
ncbi:MAG: hypothetical protein OEV94_02735 [Deltaproteobacteria bacterium]|nr:hypothetical protein [Deltaproteobacteria bacterium]